MIESTDINGKVLYEDGTHKFVWLGADPETRKAVVQTNQYLILNGGRGILLDPGGIHLFSRVVAVASRYVSLEKIDAVVFSHQDPDVSSGIALWLGVTKAKVFISSLWLRFLPHFGIVDEQRIIGIEDYGRNLELQSGDKLEFIPSHFLHSTGQYGVYDPRSKILFSSDIGAAVFTRGEEYLFVDDFDAHLPLIEGFHTRYMASRKACRAWVDMVRPLDIDMIAPQHGAVFSGDNVNKFLSWFEKLECGIDRIDTLYGGRK